MVEPQYDKSDFAPQWEYRQPTWDMFLTIREWAQEVANLEGYPIYLVGSALWKPYPRDIDLSMILPLGDFEARYGEIVKEKAPKYMEEWLKGYLSTGKFNSEAGLYKIQLDTRLRYAQRIDFKIQPDCWFRDRDKLLLAEPGGRAHVRDWEMKKVVLDGERESHD